MSKKLKNLNILKELFNLQGIANGSTGSYKVIDNELHSYLRVGSGEYRWFLSDLSINRILNDDQLEFENYEKVYLSDDQYPLFNVENFTKEKLCIYFAGIIQSSPHDIIEDILEGKGSFGTMCNVAHYETYIEKKSITPDFFQNLRARLNSEYYNPAKNSQKETIEQIEKLLNKLKP